MRASSRFVEVIGREAEKAGVDRFLDGLREGPAALVLEGEAGIGKTTVWRAAVGEAGRRAQRVLLCRASESEGAPSFLGLGDLLDGVPDEALEPLPEPQRRALELALRRSRAAEEESLDRLSLARGVLNLLRVLADETPTVVAIDDVQWLDAPSADVLRFMVHRLTDQRLGLLVSVRDAEADSLELDRALPGRAVVRLRLASLSFEELVEVVRLHLPVSYTQPTWRALHRASGGNPFFALQLADALERHGGEVPSEGLPIPETLADAVRARLAALSPWARDALLPIAALAQPTVSAIQAGAADSEGIEEAVRAGILEVEGEQVRFAHPLLASFVYGDASPAERRAVHSRLAPLVSDPEENALHVGRGTMQPDESVAALLETAANRSAKRGHPELAAELAERAARLTPSDLAGEQARRIREAAAFLYAAGDSPRSRVLLEQLVAQLPRSEERARVLRLLGWVIDDIPRATATLDQALAETGDDLRLRSQILSLLAAKKSWQGHLEAAARDLREAAELARQSGDGAALATAHARLAWIDPGPGCLEQVERAAEFERSLPDSLPFRASPSFLHGVVLLFLDRLDEARRQLEESYERGVALGDSDRLLPLGWLGELELRAGNWQRAHEHARACDELCREVGKSDAEAWGASARALVEAHLGDVGAATLAGERASRLARSIGFRFVLGRSEVALGFLSVSLGNHAAALDHLLPILEVSAGVRPHTSLLSRTLSNAVDASIGAGDLALAESLAARLEELAASLRVPSAIAAAGRCRALVLAERGDVDGSRGAIEAALAAHARLHEPFELARTHLAQGTIERRARQKAAARTALGKAEAIFTSLGARLWVERVEQELARTGLKRSLDRELTPTELRVAELAAGGAQNKQIAGALFVSVKTVEANLSRVYAKLGIRSRIELASHLSRRDDDPAGHVGVER